MKMVKLKSGENKIRLLPVYSSVLGELKGWTIQTHPRMQTFQQYYNETANASLRTDWGAHWALFLPVDINIIEYFSEQPTREGDDETSLRAALQELQ